MTSRRPISNSFDEKDSESEDSWEKTPCKSDADHFITTAPIDRLGVPGRWLRHRLLDGILVGTPVLKSIQGYRTPARTVTMKMISFLGTEDFYTVLFLLICWCLDTRLGRLFGILMGIGFYAAGFLKTLLCLPRPEWPKIMPIEKAYDWALPSHHSLLGTILPWYLWIYVHVHVELSSIHLACLFAVIALWSFSVMFSRLYLGVHSPADIVSGGFVGVLVLCLWLQVDDIVDGFISQQKLENLLQCVLILAALLYIHPKCDPGNPSFTDNCCLAGVVTGLIVARSQRSRLLGFPSLLETLPPDTPMSKFIYLSTLRLLVGAVVIFGARQIFKFLATSAIKVVFNLIGVQYYSSSEYRNANRTLFKHYTKNFHLPPIYIKKTSDSDDDDDLSSSDSTSSISASECRYFYKEKPIDSKSNGIYYSPLSWDVVVPSKCIVYSILTYIALEVVPQLFILIGL